MAFVRIMAIAFLAYCIYVASLYTYTNIYMCELRTPFQFTLQNEFATVLACLYDDGVSFCMCGENAAL